MVHVRHDSSMCGMNNQRVTNPFGLRQTIKRKLQFLLARGVAALWKNVRKCARMCVDVRGNFQCSCPCSVAVRL